jgi:uncharacterized protein (DUF433 family)
MSNAMINIFVRVFQRRMSAGETFDEIADSYPGLTDEELYEIEQKLNEKGGD